MVILACVHRTVAFTGEDPPHLDFVVGSSV